MGFGMWRQVARATVEVWLDPISGTVSQRALPAALTAGG